MLAIVERFVRLILVAATAHYGVTMTYADHRHLLGEYTMNSFPGRTLEVCFHGNNQKKVQRKKLVTRLLVREALKLNSLGLCAHLIYVDICIQFCCTGACFY